MHKTETIKNIFMFIMSWRKFCTSFIGVQKIYVNVLSVKSFDAKHSQAMVTGNGEYLSMRVFPMDPSDLWLALGDK